MTEGRCPPDHGHALTHTCYNIHKCRCGECVAHLAAEARRRRLWKATGRWEAFLVPALGTRRRLQALMAIGWSQTKLGVRLNTSQANVWTFLMGANPHVERGTHQKVAALYEELWATPPEHDAWRSKSAHNRARNYAAARRWLPPLGWDDIDTDVTPPIAERDPDYVDEVAVDHAVAGESIRLTTAERHAALVRLNELGWNDHQIAARLDYDVRTVLRIRTSLGIPAAVGADRERVDRAAA